MLLCYDTVAIAVGCDRRPWSKW